MYVLIESLTACGRCGSHLDTLSDIDGTVRVDRPVFLICYECRTAEQLGVGPLERRSA